MEHEINRALKEPAIKLSQRVLSVISQGSSGGATYDDSPRQMMEIQMYTEM